MVVHIHGCTGGAALRGGAQACRAAPEAIFHAEGAFVAVLIRNRDAALRGHAQTCCSAPLVEGPAFLQPPHSSVQLGELLDRLICICTRGVNMAACRLGGSLIASSTCVSTVACRQRGYSIPHLHVWSDHGGMQVRGLLMSLICMRQG